MYRKGIRVKLKWLSNCGFHRVRRRSSRSISINISQLRTLRKGEANYWEPRKRKPRKKIKRELDPIEILTVIETKEFMKLV